MVENKKWCALITTNEPYHKGDVYKKKIVEEVSTTSVERVLQFVFSQYNIDIIAEVKVYELSKCFSMSVAP